MSPVTQTVGGPPGIGRAGIAGYGASHVLVGLTQTIERLLGGLLTTVSGLIGGLLRIATVRIILAVRLAAAASTGG